jgi:hypothetical protein
MEFRKLVNLLPSQIKMWTASTTKLKGQPLVPRASHINSRDPSSGWIRVISRHADGCTKQTDLYVDQNGCDVYFLRDYGTDGRLEVFVMLTTSDRRGCLDWQTLQTMKRVGHGRGFGQSEGHRVPFVREILIVE